MSEKSCAICRFVGAHIYSDSYECEIDEGPTTNQARRDAQVIEDGFCECYEPRSEGEK